jgi:hypothetical protein
MSRRAQQVAQAVCGWFVHPADDGPSTHQPAATDRPETRGQRSSRARGAARAPLPSTVALLATGRGARGHGAAVALAAARRGVATVAFWGGDAAEQAAGAPAVPAARRLARSLGARDVSARARGRLVVVALPAEATAAVAAWRRAEAASADVPCMLVLLAARGPEWDAVLAEPDLVLVHGGDGDLVELAVDRLTESAATAARLDPPPSLTTRVLAMAGIALPGTLSSLRAALAHQRC